MMKLLLLFCLLAPTLTMAKSGDVGDLRLPSTPTLDLMERKVLTIEEIEAEKSKRFWSSRFYIDPSPIVGYNPAEISEFYYNSIRRTFTRFIVIDFF